MTVRVGIIGATGYTALETFRLLARHPEVEVTLATSRGEAGQPIASVHPSLAGRLGLEVTEFDAAVASQRCDLAMCCLPHGAAAETVRQLIEAGVRVIDFSADFRLSDLDVYTRYYGIEHPWPERIGKTVYGLPEWYAESIATADLVANPGCYPTSAILPLGPLLAAGLILPDDIIVDSKSGISGAGRTPKLNFMYCEAAESFSAYGVGNHRHQPEMADLLERFTGQQADLIFTPHLAPMDRGILSTIYVRPAPGVSLDATDRAIEAWREHYHETPFVRAVDHLPATKHVAHTNHVQLAIRRSGGRWVLIAAIDNLVKGASGAAVQNLNLMFGLEPTLGLT
ncbi:MAG: N-acetyl-gamma-glutamyl-phosphate reductase [Planctomycetaceae bacterium]|nr:MAG: N-acetyl-gamma-glutamyl-phosphate reductase [Planctomycetaceae bacterium]